MLTSSNICGGGGGINHACSHLNTFYFYGAFDQWGFKGRVTKSVCFNGREMAQQAKLSHENLSSNPQHHIKISKKLRHSSAAPALGRTEAGVNPRSSASLASF